MRKCDLDLAPEAPWRCPENCSAYQPRLADVNWLHGSLITPPTPEEPASVAAGDPSVAALLDDVEDIVNAAVDQAKADVAAEQAASRAHPSRSPGGWRRWFRRE